MQRRNRRGAGGMPAFVGFWFPPCRNDTYSLLRCLLCIRYGRIKLNCRYVRTCASRRKPKSPFLSECLLVSSRLHEIVLDLFEMKLLLYLILNSKCRRLYDFFTQSANVLIILTACERISSSAEDDQMALPSGHPQAFREKGLT